MGARASPPLSKSVGGRVLGPPRRRASPKLLVPLVTISLPSVSWAALSISSGYEPILNQIRRQVVCEEGDIFDPTAASNSSVGRHSRHHSTANEFVGAPPQICDSMRDGPFCRPLGSEGVGSHRPFVVDSLVSKHLFEDSVRADVASSLSSDTVEEGKTSPFVEQAMHAINLYLQNAYDLTKKLPASAPAVEGRLNLEDAPLEPTGMTFGYSKGLPDGLLASWEGSWQLVAGPTSGGGRHSATALRLNSVVGYIKFSQAVVVRKLLMHPPAPQEDDEAEQRIAISQVTFDSLKKEEKELRERLAKLLEGFATHQENVRETTKKSLELRKERARLFKVGEQKKKLGEDAEDNTKLLNEVEANLEKVDAAKEQYENSVGEREAQVKKDKENLQQIVERRLDIQDVLHEEERRVRENLGPFRIVVRGRKDGVEVWRHMYDVEASQGPGKNMKLFGGRSHCAVGDTVLGTWAGNNERFPAYVVADHGQVLTLAWLDNDHTHRFVPKRLCSTLERVVCNAELEGDLDRTDRTHSWRDMSRRTKTVDEVAILVQNGAPGWLLGDLIVAMSTTPEPDTSSSKEDEESSQSTKDRVSTVVQVSPGPMAIINEVSHAAVMYNVNEMLEQGLSLRPSPPLKARVATRSAADHTVVQSDSVNLTVSTLRPPEGIVQFLSEVSSGTDATMSLPPHVTPMALLREFESVLDLLSVYKKKVKRFVHFEAYFSFMWDLLAQADVLDVSYERWRQSPAVASVDGLFQVGQKWLGSYYCTEGTTELGLVVKRVSHTATGLHITAVFIFGSSKSASKEKVQGQYEVTGTLQPEGRILVLSPVPGSWKKRPSNFIMVGLQGVVSLNRETGRLRYAGMVPIFGCDVFQLHEINDGSAKNSTKEPAIARMRSLQNESMKELKNVDEEVKMAFHVAMMRYDELRRLWREELQRHLATAKEEQSKPKKQAGIIGQILSAVR